jgi:hypothetical protein
MLTQDNIKTIVDYIHQKLGADLDRVLPTGQDEWSTIRPIALEIYYELTSALGARYQWDEPLTQMSIELIAVGTFGTLLENAFRNAAVSEKSWADEWMNRFWTRIANIQSGVAVLDQTELVTTQPQVASEPKRFSLTGDPRTNLEFLL